MASVPPLDTSVIGLFCYYKAADSIILENCLPAFHSYTMYCNYIDGTVRVWDSTTVGGRQSSFYVHVRVRADGWILAWILRTDNRARIVWWGGDPADLPTPPTYSTRLGRAIQLVMDEAGISGFSWTGLQYYDYEYPDAARLYLFGKRMEWPGPSAWVYNESVYYYVSVPETVTVYRAMLAWIYRGKCRAYTKTGDCWCSGRVDGVQKYLYEYNVGTSWDYLWVGHGYDADVTSVLQQTGTQHTFQLNTGINAPDGGLYDLFFRHAQVVMVWTS
ncbi:MAG: hypothetical protein ACE5OO_02180 [Candidatus Bathyarchaeia archaeon]